MARAIAKTNVYTVKVGRIIGGELSKKNAKVIHEGYVCTEYYANKINQSGSTEYLEIDEKASKARLGKPDKPKK